MLQLCYGMGLRVSEVVNLKLSDIDSGRMQVLIEAGKGKKDRYVPLPTAGQDVVTTDLRIITMGLNYFKSRKRLDFSPLVCPSVLVMPRHVECHPTT